MADYDELREQFDSATDDEKLMIIRSESFSTLGTLKGYAHIIHMLAQERDISDMPDDFVKWCEIIISSAENISTVIRALTDSKHRSLMEEEKSKRDRELGEMLWADAQRGLPELKSFDSLRHAIENLALQSNEELDTSELRIDDSHLYPGGIVYYYGSERRLRVGTQKKAVGVDYLGYSVSVSIITDKRNMKWQEYSGLTKSLSVVVHLLNDWFNGNLAFEFFLDKYDWIKIESHSN